MTKVLQYKKKNCLGLYSYLICQEAVHVLARIVYVFYVFSKMEYGRFECRYTYTLTILLN